MLTHSRTKSLPYYVICLCVWLLPACALYDAANGEPTSKRDTQTTDVALDSGGLDDVGADAEDGSSDGLEDTRESDAKNNPNVDTKTDADPSACRAGHAGDDCSACPPGTYCSGGDAQPINCADQMGFDHDADSASPCTPWTICQPGQFIQTNGDDQNQRVCVACPDGAFSTDQNTTQCTTWSDCPGNTFVAQIPSKSQDRICEGCPAGTYITRTNATACNADSDLLGAGDNHTCLLDGNSDFNCWGRDLQNQPTDTNRFDFIATGGKQACGISHQSGTVSCWGLTPGSNNAPPAPTQFKYISVNFESACGIRTLDSLVTCWGRAGFSPPQATTFESISVGYYHACGIMESTSSVSNVRCWDTGSRPLYTEPGEFSAVSVGLSYTCGIRKESQTLDCWDREGQAHPIPDRMVDQQFRSVATGIDSVCGILTDASGVSCWGWTDQSRERIAQIPQNSGFDAVAMGKDHICAIRPSGQVQCWGDDTYGQVNEAP